MASVAEGIRIDIIVSQIQEPTCIKGQYVKKNGCDFWMLLWTLL